MSGYSVNNWAAIQAACAVAELVPQIVENSLTSGKRSVVSNDRSGQLV